MTARAPWFEAPPRNEVCVKYGPGAAVGVDAKCPNWNCREGPILPASAEVVNDYGVRDVRPRRCQDCGVLLEVVRIVDIEDEAAHSHDSSEASS
jgi:hypothetical protein